MVIPFLSRSSVPSQLNKSFQLFTRIRVANMSNSAPTFKDNFSKQAKVYAKYRPTYPKSLYQYLNSIVKEHDVVWDCATGNGQAAVPLSEYFKKVVATDASSAQIESAVAKSNIEYRVAAAEDSGLANSSVDLVTVAQAVHWFDLGAFYKEVRRVVKPGGVIAVWTYNLPRISPSVDSAVHRFYSEIVGPYWMFERKLVESQYRDLPFPFEKVDEGPQGSGGKETIKEFASEMEWEFDQLKGYLSSWSATQGYMKANGRDAVEEYEGELRKAWGSVDETKRVEYPIFLRAGRVL
ncbi:S-adenosyl-L-methionine-dependent methyltransferase [Paraphysoderma sedebokerense]|nr:S-adenosyl-L-methionine-dependent methyltransferase [Paraphysoderma sedebokerense]